MMTRGREHSQKQLARSQQTQVQGDGLQWLLDQEPPQDGPDNTPIHTPLDVNAAKEEDVEGLGPELRAKAVQAFSKIHYAITATFYREAEACLLMKDLTLTQLTKLQQKAYYRLRQQGIFTRK